MEDNYYTPPPSTDVSTSIDNLVEYQAWIKERILNMAMGRKVD